jgi:hypothetical protein
VEGNVSIEEAIACPYKQFKGFIFFSGINKYSHVMIAVFIMIVYSKILVGLHHENGMCTTFAIQQHKHKAFKLNNHIVIIKIGDGDSRNLCNFINSCACV